MTKTAQCDEHACGRSAECDVEWSKTSKQAFDIVATAYVSGRMLKYL